MKKAALVLILMLLLSESAYAVADAPTNSAQAAILIEASTGRVLYEKNADKSMLIASTTKIATALVVLENCNMDESVQIQPEWTGIEGSSMYLVVGTRYTVRELLGGLMLASGNDAAVALACHTAGSIADFAVRMNDLARELGCEHTHFTNPSGLDDAEHYSCARDLARIARRAIENDELRELFSSRSITVGENTYYNHNKLLTCCDGVFGIKTGYTMAAGRTLVSCCEREDMTLICVTLNDRDDWIDHEALYDWGYENWHMESVMPPERMVPLVGAQTEYVTARAQADVLFPLCEDDALDYGYELPRFVFAGTTAGATLGTANVFVNGAVAMEIPLRAAEDTLPREEPSAPLAWLKNIGRNIYTF